MSIKRILVPIPDKIDPHEEITLALSAATFLEAQVEVLFICEPPPPPPRAAVGFGDLSGMRQQAYGGQAVMSAGELRERDAQKMRARFTQACGLAHVPIVETGASPETLPSARWQEAEGQYAAIAVSRAAAFDLVVAGSAAVGASLKDIAEAALLQTGRPVLLAPLNPGRALNENPIIAWDQSPQCWRAVTAAVPFLKRAGSVQVVSVARNGANRERGQQEVLEYLACHGIAATGRVIEPQTRSVGESLLAEAGEQQSGLLVMGAYSHSRLREMLLGGVTRHILANTAVTPVLMAH